MKIQQGQAPAAAGNKPADLEKRSGGDSKFGKTLREKGEKDQVSKRRTGKEEDPPATGLPVQQQPALASGRLKSEEVAAPARARTIDAVAAEIQVHMSGDVKEVTIQFDSKVLDGLEVRIRSEGGTVSVELMTRTARAHDTVAAGVDQLSAALQAKGIPVASVRVSAPSREERERERHGGGGQQGGGGGRGGQRGDDQR